MQAGSHVRASGSLASAGAIGALPCHRELVMCRLAALVLPALNPVTGGRNQHSANDQVAAI